MVVSCGSTRFAFDRTERTIIELGGTYNKTTEEEIKKLYETDGIDEVILEVYKGTYTIVDVQGYLGDDIYKEYQKRDKELLKEIETLRQEEGLEEVVNKVLDETYPEGMIIASLRGDGTKLANDFKTLLKEKTDLKNALTTIFVELGYEGIKNALVSGEYDEETIEEYLGKSTVEQAKLIYAKETGTDGYNPTKRESNTTSTGTMKFTAASDSSVYDEESGRKEDLIIQIVAIVVVIIVIYIMAAVVRSLNRGPIRVALAIAFTFAVTALSVLGTYLIIGEFSIYFLLYILLLPIYFVFTADIRE